LPESRSNGGSWVAGERGEDPPGKNDPSRAEAEKPRKKTAAAAHASGFCVDIAVFLRLENIFRAHQTWLIDRPPRPTMVRRDAA